MTLAKTPAAAVDTTVVVEVAALSAPRTRPRTESLVAVWMIVWVAACSGVTSQPARNSRTSRNHTFGATESDRIRMLTPPIAPTIIAWGDRRAAIVPMKPAASTIARVWAPSIGPAQAGGAWGASPREGANRR